MPGNRTVVPAVASTVVGTMTATKSGYITVPSLSGGKVNRERKIGRR